MKYDLEPIFHEINDGVYIVDRDRKITFWNKGAERITGFTAKEVVNKRCSDNVLTHVDHEGTQLCLCGCPLEATFKDGQNREARVFLHHKDGYRIPVLVRAIPLYDEEGNRTAVAEVFIDQRGRINILSRVKGLEQLAFVDQLTGLANRHLTEIELQSRLRELKRFGWPFGLLFIDLDNFKNINDKHGHTVGDRVLKMVGKTLAYTARDFDLYGRWGGEEFVGIIFNVDKEGIISAGKRAKTLVERSYIMSSEKRIAVTLSIGATLARHDDDLDSLVNRGDRLMYESKSKGRNRISFG